MGCTFSVSAQSATSKGTKGMSMQKNFGSGGGGGQPIGMQMGGGDQQQATGPSSQNENLTEPPADVSELDKAVFKAQNEIRANPQSFIAQLEERLQHFDGNVLNMPGAECGTMTQEGPAAIKEAIECLKK